MILIILICRFSAHETFLIIIIIVETVMFFKYFLLTGSSKEELFVALFCLYYDRTVFRQEVKWGRERSGIWKIPRAGTRSQDD